MLESVTKQNTLKDLSEPIAFAVNLLIGNNLQLIQHIPGQQCVFNTLFRGPSPKKAMVKNRKQTFIKKIVICYLATIIIYDLLQLASREEATQQIKSMKANCSCQEWW